MQNHIKHTHRRISRDSIRIAFQLPATHLDKPYKVWRIRQENGYHAFRLEGLVLECTKTGGHAVVAHVIVGDTLMITHHPQDGVTPPHRGFRIGDSLEPIPLDDLAPFTVNQIITDGPSIDFDGRRFIHFKESDLRQFFRGRHPDWLQEHIDATLRLWRAAAPDFFARVAPSCWLVRKPWFLAMYDPERALAEFPHLVKGSLGRYCIRRMTAPAPRILPKFLPSSIKPARVFQNAEFLLDQHAGDLTDDELRACACSNPFAAIRCFEKTADSRKRAILLSTSFHISWTMPQLLKCEEFRSKVVASLTEHAAEWAMSHPEGLLGALRMVSARIPFRPTPDELNQMLNGLAPALRRGVAEFVATRI